MNPSPSHHATERFTGLAQLYAKSRPGYPDAALDFLMDRCGLRPGSMAVDLGCGTGISTRLFAQRGLRGQQTLDEDGFVGRGLSASYAPKEPAALQKYADDLRAVFVRFQQGGRATLCYETAVWSARRRDG